MSFSTKLLNNYFELKSFLSGENAILFLKENADKVKLPKKDELYFGRWQVVWIICKIPFEFILSLFFSAVSTLTHLVGCSCISQTCTVLAKQMMRGVDQLHNQNEYKTRLLVPAFNDPKINAYDLYMKSPFPVNQIKDSNIKKITFDSAIFEEGIQRGMRKFYSILKSESDKPTLIFKKQTADISLEEKTETEKKFKELILEKGIKQGFEMLEKKYPFSNVDDALASLYKFLKKADCIRKNTVVIPFFNAPGVCRGATIWFNYLFIKTQHLFQDPKKHLIAIAELFRTGVPSQGCLLQALGPAEESMLGLKCEHLIKHSVSLYEMDLRRDKAVKKLQDLPNGVFFFGVREHAFSYIKISETEGYIWNPNSGLLTLDRENQAQQLLNEILTNHYVEGDKNSFIFIIQQSLPDKKIQEQEKIA